MTNHASFRAFAPRLCALLAFMVFMLPQAWAQTPAFSFSGTPADSLTIAEGTGSAVVTISLSPAASGSTTVTYLIEDNTATAGVDYMATHLASTTLTFAAGETEKTIMIPIIDDELALESIENFTITLTASSTGTERGSVQVFDVFITDNDAVNVRFADDVSVNESAGNMTFTLIKDKETATTFTVDTFTTDGTATNGEDYTGGTDTLTFNTGANDMQTRAIPITDDDTIEDAETLTLSIVEIANDNIEPTGGPATGTIVDNDRIFSFAENSYTVAEEVGSATVTVTLEPASSVETTVTYRFDDNTATAGLDYTATDRAEIVLTFAPGDTEKTIEIPIIDDDIALEPIESFTMTLTGSGAGTGVTMSGIAVSEVFITDNDEVTVSFVNDEVSVDEGAGNMTFTLTTDKETATTFTVDTFTTDGTATAGEDYTGGTRTVTFGTAAGNTQTTMIPIIDDNELEGDETLTLTVLDIPNDNIIAPSGAATGTILASEFSLAAPSVQTLPAGRAIEPPITLPEASSDEATGEVSYTLTIKGESGLPDGLAFNADRRELSGTPTKAGSYTLTYTATDDDVTAERDFEVTVELVLADRMGALAGGDRLRFDELPVTFPAVTHGADGNVTYTLTRRPSGALPAWLTFDANMQRLSIVADMAAQARGRVLLRYTATDSATPTPNTITLEVTLGGDPERRESGIGAMVGAVGRALGWDMAGVIRNRARAGRSGNHAPVAVSGVSGEATLDDLITRGASVDMALNAAAADDGGGANQVPAGRLWAKVGRSEFDNEPLNDYEQDGSLTSLHAGVDVQSGPDRLFGAAIGWHDAQVDYDDREAEVEGELELELLTINPYASQTRDRWHTWGTVGFGVGEMTYTEQDDGGNEDISESNVTLWNAAGGLEYTLDFIGASELTARGEGMFLSMDVDGTDNENLEFGPLRTDVYGARGEVEVGLPMVRADGGTMRPFAVLGMRWEDGDDAGDGLSAELGGGITARSRDFFVDADLRARTGVEDEVGDALAWGLSLGFDVKNDHRGLAVELHHQSGPQPWDPFADNGLATASETSTDTGDTPATLGATTRYGLDYRNGRMTPYNTLRFDGGLLSEVETGIQYRLSDISLGLKHVYEPNANADEHSLKLTGRITF